MRVLRLARVVLCAIAAAAVSGCIQSSTLIKLKPDGSGTIEQTLTMNADAVAQFSALGAMSDDKNKDKKPGGIDNLFSEADARAAVSKMGEGVTFVSSQKIDTPERKGMKAIYAFTDVRKLSVSEMTMPAGADSGASGAAGAAPKDPPVTFTFKQLPGGNALLTILQPGVDKAMTNPQAKPDTAADPKMGAQGLEMAKAFMKGLKIDVAIQVPRVVKTNSAYVDGGTVTILSMDFDKVLADPSAIEKLNKAKTLADSKALLKDVKGIKVNLEPQVTIEFAGR
jgi:hypothetical protein